MAKRNKTPDFTAFERKFPTDKKCLEKIFKMRWRNGYRCPRCNCAEAWEVSPYKYKCRNCGYQTTVTAGTFFHGTHLSMKQWFKAIYYYSVRREKASAAELQKLIEIGSNRTAQSLLKKIKPMAYCSSEWKLSCKNNLLDGIVGIDVKYINIKDRQYKVCIAAELPEKSIGRICVVRVKDNVAVNLCIDAVKQKYLTKNSTVIKSHIVTRDIANDFERWCIGQENDKFNSLVYAYNKMINQYKIHVTFNEILKNMIGNDRPPKYDSCL